jgi:hypothetical protein
MEVHKSSLSEIEHVFYPLGTRLSANSDSVVTYSIKALKCGDERNKKGPVQYFRGNLTYEEAVYGLKYAFMSLNNSKYRKLRFDCKNMLKYCDDEKEFHSDCILFEKTELDKLYIYSIDIYIYIYR